jgi:hypothetical protein
MSLCKSFKIKLYVKHHINTAIRLSGKLCNHEAKNDERMKTEHKIFVHLNAARRASKLS